MCHYPLENLDYRKVCSSVFRRSTSNSLELFNLVDENGRKKDKNNTQKRAVEITGTCQKE